MTASNDFNLKVWNVKTGSEKIKLTGHLSAVNKVAYKVKNVFLNIYPECISFEFSSRQLNCRLSSVINIPV